MPIQVLKERMPEWVGKVPYSNFVNKTWGYPTDCSGFVSWALNTSTDVKAYEFGSETYAAKIDTDSLRFGDIITHVWAPIFKSRCASKNSTDEVKNDGGIFDYLSGHVIFFDKWTDENHTHFWAYESTQTEDQTPECYAHTPEMCFNHHVIKSRKKIDKWSKDSCKTSEYGVVTGGAHRLSPSLLCPQ